MTHLSEQTAMARAIDLAADPHIRPSPNPRVGCVLLDDDGQLLASGSHARAGEPHAEVIALRVAGDAARGATAVITLEPCNHTGRTGPCTEALIASGVRRVVYAVDDPNPVAAGGADRLRAAGIEVESGLMAAEAAAMNRSWLFAVTHDRPYVTLKLAATLDGYITGAVGRRDAITGEEARLDTHRLRAAADAIVVGANTVVVDNPALTVRDVPMAQPPLRVVVGQRDLPASARLFTDGAALTLHVRTHDPREVLDACFDQGVRHVLVEGGAEVASAFVRAGFVDEIVWYLATRWLGHGVLALTDSDLDAFEIIGAEVLGGDVRLTMRPRPH